MSKTAKTSIAASAKIAELANEVFGDAAKEGMGILEDHLKFVRWKLKNRLAEKFWEIRRERSKLGKPCAVEPIFALKILEKATLEEDDELQNIWIRLLDSAGRIETKTEVRRSFISIVEDLEPFDAKVLEIIYNLCLTRWDAIRPQCELLDSKTVGYNPRIIHITRHEVKRIMKCDDDRIDGCLDNLFRLRLLMPYIEEKGFEAVDDSNSEEWHTVTVDHQYSEFQLTISELRFIEACITKNSHNYSGDDNSE